MGHAEDTLQRWNETVWVESVCDRWDDFFLSLMDQPDRAQALCALGMMVVKGHHAAIAAASAGSTWLSFFGVLIGRPQKAGKLCGLGIEMVSRGSLRQLESYRDKARDILMSNDGDLVAL